MKRRLNIDPYMKWDVRGNWDDRADKYINQLRTFGQEADAANMKWLRGGRTHVGKRIIQEIHIGLEDIQCTSILFYRSLGVGTGPESKGEWVPFPGFAENNWFIKSSREEAKVQKYGSTTFQEIAEYLKEEDKWT